MTMRLSYKSDPSRTTKISAVALSAVLAGLLFVHSTQAVAQTSRLNDVRERGSVKCGVNPDLSGFSKVNSLGEYAGFDIDICRAVAAAVFGDGQSVEFVPVSAPERFVALVAGEFEVLARNTTWTLERNTDYGEFAGVNYYDGQGFMVTKKSGFQSAVELDNVPICVSRGTTTEANAIDFFEISDLRYNPVYFDDEIDAVNAYADGACTALTMDRSALAGQRSALEIPDAHVLLPEIISKEPLGPMVPGDDRGWENVVRWSLNCMIAAEEMGLNQANVDNLSSVTTPAMKRLLGIEGDTGERLGLSKDWCMSIIKAVGSYSDVYERHLGTSTSIGLDRGVNALWTDGGLMYAPPF